MKAAFWCIVLTAATVVMWITGINVAWQTGDWVGASHIPVPQAAQLAAFATSIADACVAVVCLLLAKWRRSVTLAIIGGVALAMAGGTFATSVWFLVMGGIT